MEYTDKQLKEMCDEYYRNQIKIKEMLKDEEILTEAGTNKYYTIKGRQHEILEILNDNGVKP